MGGQINIFEFQGEYVISMILMKIRGKCLYDSGGGGGGAKPFFRRAK